MVNTDENAGNVYAGAAYAPLSYQDCIGLYNDDSRAHEWFDSLAAYLKFQKLPLSTSSTIVKQLVPGRDQNKVDLAHDESSNIDEFVAELKRRLLRRSSIIKRTKSLLKNRTRRSDEPISDYILLIKADLKSAFPDLEEKELKRLAQYECWKQLPDEMSCRVCLKKDDDLDTWCDRVDTLFEVPPPAVASEINACIASTQNKREVPANINSTQQQLDKITAVVQQQGIAMEKMSRQLELLMQKEDRPTTNRRPAEINTIYYKCPQPAVKQLVKRKCPNNGLSFFTCPNPREVSYGFFQWDDAGADINTNWRSQGNDNARRNQSSGNGRTQ